MPETQADTTLDSQPALVICAYDMGQTAWDPVEDRSSEPWRPVGARTIDVAADEAEVLERTLSRHLADPRCRGALLVGRTRLGDVFRIQVRALNRSLDGPCRLDRLGPGVVRATAPGADMVRALNEAGLAAAVCSEAEDDVGSYLLYRVLANLSEGGDTPAVGLLRAPDSADDMAVCRAVKAAAQTMARHMSPLPRSRVS